MGQCWSKKAITVMDTVQKNQQIVMEQQVELMRRTAMIEQEQARLTVMMEQALTQTAGHRRFDELITTVRANRSLMFEVRRTLRKLPLASGNQKLSIGSATQESSREAYELIKFLMGSLISGGPVAEQGLEMLKDEIKQYVADSQLKSCEGQLTALVDELAQHSINKEMFEQVVVKVEHLAHCSISPSGLEDINKLLCDLKDLQRRMQELEKNAGDGTQASELGGKELQASVRNEDEAGAMTTKVATQRRVEAEPVVGFDNASYATYGDVRVHPSSSSKHCIGAGVNDGSSDDDIRGSTRIYASASNRDMISKQLSKQFTRGVVSIIDVVLREAKPAEKPPTAGNRSYDDESYDNVEDDVIELSLFELN